MAVCVHVSFLCEGQGGDEPGQHHGGCALDVVVEASGLVSVALQQAEGIQVAEVFKLNNPHTYTHYKLMKATASIGLRNVCMYVPRLLACISTVSPYLSLQAAKNSATRSSYAALRSLGLFRPM